MRLEGSPENRSIFFSGAGRSLNGTCSGGGIVRKIRSGRNTVIYIRFGRSRVCLTPNGLHRERTGSFRFFGKKPASSNISSSRIIHLICYIFVLLFSLAYYVVVTNIRDHIAGPSPPCPLRSIVGGILPKSIFSFFLHIGRV